MAVLIYPLAQSAVLAAERIRYGELPPCPGFSVTQAQVLA